MSKVIDRDNSLAAKCPELAKQWHPTKNGDLTPEDISYGSGKTVWWFLPYDDPKTGKHFDFEWQAVISSRASGGNGCPFLSKTPAVRAGFNDLKTLRPDLAAQWHPTKNGSISPQDVTCGSDMFVWWLLPYDDPETGKHFDFEWETSVNNRVKSGGNPFVDGNRVWKGFNDLATVWPELAAQWHPTKNRGIKPEETSDYGKRKVWWRCEKGHEMFMSVEYRVRNGGICPDCRKERIRYERKHRTEPGTAKSI